MNLKQTNPDGISEVVSVILIIALVLILACIIYLLISGSLSSLLMQTSRVAALAGTTTVPLADTIPPMQIIDMYSVSGDHYTLTGQQNLPPVSPGTPVVTFTLLDPHGSSYPVIPTLLSSNANKFGTPLYFYKSQNSVYRVTDNLSSISYAPAQVFPFDLGNYKITMIDNTANVILDTMDVTVTGNATPSAAGSTVSLPASPILNVAPNATWTMYGGVTNSTDPSGLTIYTFDGTSGYLSGQSNPALAFTGDMTLSFWMDPTATGDPNNPSNWHTIIGKGQLNSDGTESDDYQLVQLGDQLYFEWNDANTGTHYNILTNGAPISAGAMQYVTVSVNNGVPAVMVNGNTESFSMYAGNEPQEDNTPITPVAVDMDSNNDNLLTGKQNGPPGDEFYYQGTMSEVALYNYAISADAIVHNLDYDQI